MNKVIEVGNEKAKSMIYTPTSVRFINKKVESIEAFNEIFDKKLTLTDKGEILFSDMKKLEISNLTVDPNAGMKFGNSVSDIEFKNADDLQEFVNYVSQIKGWSKVEKQLSPLNAIKWDVLGLIVAPIATYFFRGMALDMENGVFTSSADGYSKSERRTRTFENILEMIGSTGILIIGILVIAYFAYSIYKKYHNPPVLVSYE